MKRHSAAYLASPFVLLQKHCKKHTLNVVCMSYTTFKVNMWQVLIELFVITVEIFAETSFFMWFLLVSSKTFRSAIPENVSTKRLFYFNICWHHQKSVVNHGIIWESTMPSRGILGDSESPTSPLHKTPSHLIFSNKWDKLFKNGPSQIFKGCLPQILLGPFLNTFSQM